VTEAGLRPGTKGGLRPGTEGGLRPGTGAGLRIVDHHRRSAIQMLAETDVSIYLSLCVVVSLACRVLQMVRVTNL